MTILIIFLTVYAAAWMWCVWEIVTARSETELFGTLGSLYACDPWERPAIVARHPELLDHFPDFHPALLFVDCGPELRARILRLHPELFDLVPAIPQTIEAGERRPATSAPRSVAEQGPDGMQVQQTAQTPGYEDALQYRLLPGMAAFGAPEGRMAVMEEA